MSGNDNVYIKMIKLACNNVRTEICRLNMFSDNNIVQVKIRGKDSLIRLTERIVKNSKNAITLYSQKADKHLVIRCSEPTVRMLTASEIFVESIVKSKEARVAQKRLVELLATEQFLHEAYVYDSRHKAGLSSAMDKAKDIVTDIYTINILGSFDFTAMGPFINPELRKVLEDTAFDRKFSFMSKDTVVKLSKSKYQKLYHAKVSLFAKDAAANKAARQVSAAKKAIKQARVHSKETPITSKTLLLTDLYRGAFATLPLDGRRRKFINLKMRNNDIMIAPKSALVTKRQFASIASMSHHKYIMDYYSDQMPADLDKQDAAQYLFRQENKMYKYMWGAEKSVHYQNGRLYFPDGTNMVIPKEYAPHEFFHKVNTTYAALFGFGKQDKRGGKEWLYDAIRKAYTDEGTADYRLSMIEARLSGKLKS